MMARVARVSKTCTKCGNPRDMAAYASKRQHCWCKVCHAAYMRAYRARVPMTADQRRKDAARSYAGVYLRRGILKRQPCSRCGSEKAQMHHHDYSKPLEVEWMCRGCHMLHHGGEP